MIASVLFVVCVLLILTLQRQLIVHENPMSVGQAYADIREAVGFLIKEPFLGPMQVFGPLFAFFLIPISTVVFPSWFVFAGKDSYTLGTFLGAQALGGMIGGFVFSAFAPKVSQHKWLIGATAAYAATLTSLYFLQPGSIVSIVTGFMAGVVFTGIMAIPYTAFYTRTPQRLLGRVNSLGAASGYLVAAIAALLFGWLVNSTSAKTGILVCAIGMGLLSLGIANFPFMRLLDQKREPDLRKEVTENREPNLQ
jgi:MFS family permease